MQFSSLKLVTLQIKKKELNFIKFFIIRLMKITSLCRLYIEYLTNETQSLILRFVSHTRMRSVNKCLRNMIKSLITVNTCHQIERNA